MEEKEHKPESAHHASAHHLHHSHARHAFHPVKKKSPLKRYLFGGLVFVVLVAVVIVVILLTTKSGENRLSRGNSVAAVVNDEQITVEYLDEQYSRVPEMYKQYITKSMLLNQTINEVLLLQEAKKQGVAATEEEVKKEIDDAMSKSGVTEDQLDERLKEQNITRDFLEELYMKQLTINKLLDKTVFAKIKISDSEIADFYDSRIHAMHVLVETETEAKQIISQLKKVQQDDLESKFAEIAKAKSKDPSAATNGGDLGEFGKGQMVAEFEKAAFGLDEFEFTAEPVKTQFGYHVILRLPKEQSLDEQSDSIKEFLLTQKKSQAVPLYLEQLRSKADIQVMYVEEPAKEKGTEALDLGLVE